LLNIIKEIKSDIGKTELTSGDLSIWANQGVLLLNSILTVRAGEPASHREKGWEVFTDLTLKTISDQTRNVVFLLWGAFAQSKRNLVDTKKHLILEAPHPSPLSAHRGFMGCKHFSKANEYLEAHFKKPIRW
jgi:uracil-DNA glycosylase